MQRTIVGLTVALAIAACGGGEGATNPPPASVASVVLSEMAATINVGESFTLTASGKDASGNTLAGRTVTWTSDNSSVATVVAGTVSAVSPGTARITATIDSKTATATITVQLTPVYSIAVTPTPVIVRPSATRQLFATLSAANGTVLTGRAVTWSSSDESKATVSQAGVVTGIAVGTLTIRATSEGKTGAAAVTVTDMPEPTVTAVSPALLAPGVTATITGTNFASVTTGNSVTISGVAVAVTAATPTQLTVTLPTPFPCRHTGDVPVVVATDGGSASRPHPLQVATQRALSVGQALILSDAAQATCNELGMGGGRYMVSVYSASTAPSSQTAFELHGNGTTAVAASARLAPLATAANFSLSRSPLSEMLATRAAGQRQHLALLEEDRQILSRVGRPTPRRRSAARSVAASAVPLTVGAMTTLKVRSTSDRNCSAADAVRARVVYVGTKSLVLEDSLATFAGTMDADYVAIGHAFDDVMYPILTANFGDPLAFDDSLDSNRRIMMLFTKKVNDRGAGLLGFVTLCDFYSPTRLAASNGGEIFYARVPTSSGSNPRDFNTVPGWRAFMKSTVIHEAKHIVSYAERFQTPIIVDVLEEAWLEEGTAQVASELYARSLYGIGWKQNVGYRPTVYCDVRSDVPGPCAGSQFLMADHFSELYSYFRNNESQSYLTIEEITVYGSAWMFSRWLTDQFATNESAFLRALTLEFTKVGVANVEDKAGRPFAELNGAFALALGADDYPGFSPPAGARFTIPSWNVPDIFAGFSLDYPQNFIASPLRRHSIVYGDFNEAVPGLRGGGAAFFDVSGTQSTAQLLDLRGSGGSAPPPTLRMAILRVQ